MKKQIILLAGLFTLLLTGCYDRVYTRIDGEGDYITKEREIGTFTKIKSEIVADIFIEQNQEQSFEIEAQENIMNLIKTYVSGECLYIEYTRKRVNHDGIDIYISMADLEKVEISGVGDVVAEDDIVCTDLELIIDGVGDMKFESLYAEYINIFSDGVGKIELEGQDTVDELDINISGVGSIYTVELPVSSVIVSHSGTSTCKVFAIDNLDVILDGVGNVYYKGSPSISQQVSGIGKLKKLD